MLEDNEYSTDEQKQKMFVLSGLLWCLVIAFSAYLA